jgi:hypothetical protein
MGKEMLGIPQRWNWQVPAGWIPRYSAKLTRFYSANSTVQIKSLRWVTKNLKKTAKKTPLWQRWFPSGSLDPCWWVSRNVTGNRTWNKWYWRNESRRTFSNLQPHARVAPTVDGGGSRRLSSKFSSTLGTDRKLWVGRTATVKTEMQSWHEERICCY